MLDLRVGFIRFIRFITYKKWKISLFFFIFLQIEYMLDLYKKQYSRQELKAHIYELKLLDILKTQTLDITFIVRYILSDLYQIDEEDTRINIDTVIYYQPHINKYELIQQLTEYNSDDDSVEDFQSYAERTANQ